MQMYLRSYNIKEFSGANEANYVEKTLIQTDIDQSFVSFSLLVANNDSENDAHVIVNRKNANNEVLFTYSLSIEESNSPIALDSTFTVSNGEKLTIESNNSQVAATASGVDSKEYIPEQ